MSRVNTSTTSREAAPSAEQVRQTLAGRHVCPYCGHQTAGGTDPCPRCTMEDTPATRQATKARIGPWYVLQSRNPAAPGMKYATLLALINKGHVTARSIVRGPTTHQLWRFAAHVKGISREFGLCYSCGGHIEEQSSLCPHCQRTQDAPPEPDVLVEARSNGHPTPEPAAPAAAASYASRMREINRPRQPEVDANGAPIARPRPDVRRINGQVVSGMELAAALQDESQAVLRSPRRAVFKTAASLLFLIVSAGVLVYYFKPEYRQPAMAWVDQTWTSAKAKVNSIEWPRISARAPVKNAPPVLSEPEPPVVVNREPVREPEPKVELPAPDPERIAQETAAPSTPPQAQPEPQPVAVQEPPAPAPAPVAQQAEPALPPAPVAPSLPPDAQARELWKQALDAEAKNDVAGAIKLYEQIKTLPKDVWPKALNVYHDIAKQRLAQSNAQ